jgi:hypothetical protein
MGFSAFRQESSKRLDTWCAGTRGENFFKSLSEQELGRKGGDYKKSHFFTKINRF